MTKREMCCRLNLLDDRGWAQTKVRRWFSETSPGTSRDHRRRNQPSDSPIGFISSLSPLWLSTQASVTRITFSAVTETKIARSDTRRFKFRGQLYRRARGCQRKRWRGLRIWQSSTACERTYGVRRRSSALYTRGNIRPSRLTLLRGLGRFPADNRAFLNNRMSNIESVAEAKRHL